MNRSWLVVASLTPLLGATRTLAQALTIGLCAILLIGLHQALMAPLRRHLVRQASLCASVLLSASLTTCLYLGLNAWALPMARELALYPLLLALPCQAIEQLPRHKHHYRQLGLGLGGLLAASIALGGCRQLLTDGIGLHIAMLAPGALLLLGLLLGFYNYVRPSTTSSRRQGSR